MIIKLQGAGGYTLEGMPKRKIGDKSVQFYTFTKGGRSVTVDAEFLEDVVGLAEGDGMSKTGGFTPKSAKMAEST